jgi:PAS domain S-box-containing protein
MGSVPSPFDLVPLRHRSFVLGLVAGVLGVVGAAVLTSLLEPYTTQNVFLVPFLAAVFGAAWVGGVRPALATTLLAVIAVDYLFAAPRGSFVVAPVDLVRLAVFTVVAVLVAGLVEARDRLLRRLEEQREWLLVTLASAGDALVVTDDDARVVFLNPVAEGLLGWTAQEAHARPLHEVFRIANEATREPVANPVARVMATGKVVGLANHTVLIARDGREVPIDDSASPVRDRDGQTRGVVLLFRDVTARRDVERRLAEQGALFEQALDSVFARDLDRTIVFWNRAAERLYGWTSNEAVGQNPHELLHTVFPVWVEEVERALLEKGVWEGEVTHTCRDGREVVEESRHVLVRDDEGRPRLILEINRDITKRRIAEVERERALREAREANRLKDDFLSTLSHELRTPLNAILGWSQILAQSSLDAETTRRALRTISRNAEAQSQLIADVLDVSRIVSGKMRLSIQRVDLARVAADALESVRPAADAKGVVLRPAIEGPNLWVSADPDRVQQILWNLLSNAIKFTPRGGEVRLEVGSSESRVRIRVTDTGIGIPPDFLPRVFERFSQRDSSFSRAHGGLGLGLAIVRHLAEAHGGGVTAESGGEGKGASFTVQLPIKAVCEEGEELPAADGRRAIVPTGDGVALDGLRVLVVDDEEDARELVREVLSRHGAEVRCAPGAEAALQFLQDERFDLLVADIGMPGVDGYELIRHVRALPSDRGGQVMALAVTAYGRPEDRLWALAAGYQQHLAKPVMPGELVVVAASLFRRRANGTAPTTDLRT